VVRVQDGVADRADAVREQAAASPSAAYRVS
jgi:hypothetical protein